MMRRCPQIISRDARRPARGLGFTLIELLVVITIVILVSAVALTAAPGLVGNYQVNEGARLVQAALGGARDAAIRANAPRGVRLLPDPTLTDFTGAGRFTANRLLPIEPAPDLSEGYVTFAPNVVPSPGVTTLQAGAYSIMTWGWNSGSPPRYPKAMPGYLGQAPFNLTNVYPCYPPTLAASANNPILIAVECKVQNNDVNPAIGAIPNPPTNWFWNVRVGDKIRFGGTGQYYTVVGPMTVATSDLNPENFVNIGLPGAPLANTDALSVNYRDVNGNVTSTYPEFLFLVNGNDDNNNGYVDEGFNGLDENLDGVSDDIGEWYGSATNGNGPTSFNAGAEIESWQGSQASSSQVSQLTWRNPPQLTYTIVRRPVPSPGARETVLPSSVVIDLTTYNTTRERSRLPDPVNGAIDILLNPSGQVISGTTYSTPAAARMDQSFYHFWIADRGDVYDPIYPPNPPLYPSLPVPESTSFYPPTYNLNLNGQFLKKDRQLVTLYTRTGQVVSNSINNFQLDDPSTQFVETDPNRPYFEAQLGIREAK